MLRVLGRDDLKIKPADMINDPQLPAEVYFIALNSFEKGIAEDNYPLELVKEFTSGNESSAIYRVISDRNLVTQ